MTPLVPLFGVRRFIAAFFPSACEAELRVSGFPSRGWEPVVPVVIAVLLTVCLLLPASLARAGLTEAPPGGAIGQVQPKVVKVYGAGGVRGLEAYQSGIMVSADGHILTVWSHVLDTDEITVILFDGRRFTAKLVGADPRLEIALLKIDAADLPYFDLAKAVEAEGGTRVLAFSNLFGIAQGNEPVSVQRGTVAAVTQLEARRGVFQTPYSGPVYVLDVVVNNPGAAGGALVTRQGELVGLLGKELRNALNNTWLNYALPIGQLAGTVEEIRGGRFVARQDEPARRPDRAMSLSLLGILTVPDVLPRTPPYIDQVYPGSPAAKAGLMPDDLVVFVGDHLVQSCKSLRSELELIDFEDTVRITVLRGGRLQPFELRADQPIGESP